MNASQRSRDGTSPIVTESQSNPNSCNRPKWRHSSPKRYRKPVEGALQVPDSYPSGKTLALPHAIPDDQRKQLRIRRQVRCCTVRFCYEFRTRFPDATIVHFQASLVSARWLGSNKFPATGLQGADAVLLLFLFHHLRRWSPRCGRDRLLLP